MKDAILKKPAWKDFDWKSFRRDKRVWIAIPLLLIVIVGGYLLYRSLTENRAQVDAAPQIQTAVARQGNLTVFATGAGEVIAASELELGFDEAGTLTEALIKPGDKVTAGQALARLQTTKTQEDIDLALAEARLNAITAQQDLDEIYESAQMDAAQALKDVEDAEQALEDIQDIELRQAEALQAIAEAEQGVKDAERIYNSVRSTADQASIDAAHAELVLAESKLKDMQEKYNDYADKPDENLQKANALLKLSAAQGQYNSALSYYNALTGTGSQLDREQSEADLAAAKAELAQAQRAYERIKDGPTPGEVALAEAELAVAQASYEKLKSGPDPSEIALAEATLADAQAKLAVAEEDQAVIELNAPTNGTILSVDASVGESIGASAFITLANLDQPVLTVYFDESDLNKVGVGYEAEVTFDSLPETTFTGHVTEVSPSLQNVANVDTVVAQVQLDSDSFAKPQTLPVGSNASVDVIGGRAENAVLVPVEALREIDTDEYAVFVMENGEPRLRVVTVGLIDYTTAEITSGLEAGEVVTTGVVETVQSNSQE